MSEPGTKMYTALWFDEQTTIKATRDRCHRCNEVGLVEIEDGTQSGTFWRCGHVAQDFDALTLQYLDGVPGFPPG